MTVIVATPDFPPLLAAMCTTPMETPVTTPLVETVATAVFSLLQKMFEAGLPLTVALSVTLLPSAMESDEGEMATPPPPGPVESPPPHEIAAVRAAAHASAETSERNFEKGAARIEHSVWRGSHAHAARNGGRGHM